MNLLDLFYLPAAVLTAPWWARKSRGGWRERFGHVTFSEQSAGSVGSSPRGKRLLLHAVSVGEVNTLRHLVPKLRDAGIEVIVSATTDTGLARARVVFGNSPLAESQPGRPGVRVVRYPLDFSSSVRRFLDTVRPDGVALVELEIWPNFVTECDRRGIPVAVINGRLSSRSFRGYSRFSRFLSPSFRRLRFAAVQDQSYADRFIAMGVPPDRCPITGSMKWDAVSLQDSPAAAPAAGRENPSPEAARLADELGIDLSRPLVVAGSTAVTPTSCEEALLSAACPNGVQLLCAPRKPEHYERAFLAMGGPSRCVRRSRTVPGSRAARPQGADRFLLDTIGELRTAYSLADVAVVGRSFGTLRGSDPIEPIALGKPTIIGPAYANFEYIVGRFIAAGAIRATNSSELKQALTDLLDDAAARRLMIDAGFACIEAERGASARHAELLKQLLGLPTEHANHAPILVNAHSS